MRLTLLGISILFRFAFFFPNIDSQEPGRKWPHRKIVGKASKDSLFLHGISAYFDFFLVVY